MNKPIKNSEEKEPLEIFLVQRFSFGVFSGLAGLVYAGVIFAILQLLGINISGKPICYSFMMVFGLLGIALGSQVIPIVMSAVYGFMYLWGLLIGFVGYHHPTWLTEHHFPTKSEYLWFVVLGIFSFAIYLLIR